MPDLQLLSNGRYHVMVTAAGGEAHFAPGTATLHARCLDIDTSTDIMVAPRDDVEFSTRNGDPSERMRQAMEAVDADLVHRDAALVQLLDPPFEHPDPSPGYIQRYLPGVRENGGQYTHAAVWSAMAFAALGDAKRASELFTMLDPIRHAHCARAIALYKVAPCVIASDVYAEPPRTGRGGWTWHTGSAGWMLRFMLESALGLHVEADQLRMHPCCPEHWPTFELNYRWRETLYRIEVHRSSSDVPGSGWWLDGIAGPIPALTLVDDHRDHTVIVRPHQRGA